jgi:hypothetical protein
VTPERARERVRKLLALAAVGSGATQEEARNAALAAAHLILEHGLLDGGQSSPVDLDEVAVIALKAIELERLLAAERAAHAADLGRRDQRWGEIVAEVRKGERANARVERQTATRKAVREDRTARARAGGRERARRLTSEEKSEIGRRGAQERWRLWRERHGT